MFYIKLIKYTKRKGRPKGWPSWAFAQGPASAGGPRL